MFQSQIRNCIGRDGRRVKDKARGQGSVEVRCNKIPLNINVYLIISSTAQWAIRDRRELGGGWGRGERGRSLRGSADRSLRSVDPRNDRGVGGDFFPSLICALQGHESSLVRMSNPIVGTVVTACARHVAILREGDTRYRLRVRSWCPCHEPKRHVDPKMPITNRTIRSADGDLETAASLLYGIFISTSAILKIESSGCVCISWCLLLILSLRSCIIDAHSSCKLSILISAVQFELPI